MALPPEFKTFKNEADFTQRFLIPLLQRLGFSVVNYHSSAEYGKDVVFSELDRFGAVRFHGLQAKFADSISLNEMQELIVDAEQAFNNPFRHPQTGMQERISTFYAVNAGALSPQGSEHFFNSLRPKFGGNAQLMQGKDLLTLDRWAAVNRQNDIGAILSGMSLEMNLNEALMRLAIEPKLMEIEKGMLPAERFRCEASSAFLERPILTTIISIDAVFHYWKTVKGVNTMLDSLSINTSATKAVAKNCLDGMANMRSTAAEIVLQVQKASAQLGPLAAA